MRATTLIVLFLCASLFSFLGVSTASAATRQFPANGSDNVCPDTPLKITFDAPPVLGTAGTIQILDSSDGSVIRTVDISSPTATQSIGGLTNYKYYPVILNGNEADVYLPNGALAYGKTYRVVISAGVFNDKSGAPAALGDSDWHFTTRAAPPPAPAAGSQKITVAADGSGDFCTVQGAVDSLPAGNTAPIEIFIRNGTYTEMVNFSAKNNLTFRGEDRKKTIIAYATNDRFNNATGTYRRGVFQASKCSDLTIDNLTLHNTTPYRGSQAEAIILNGSVTARAKITNLDLYSFQDTLQINGQAYIADCYIEGDVDFMWGKGPCFFENCECKSMHKGAYYTQIRNLGQTHGYVYYHCTFDGAPGVTGMFLSRIDPRRFPNSEVVLIDCTLTDAVAPVAWRLDGSQDAPAVHYWEFNSHDSTGKPVDASKRLVISKQLAQPADAELITHYSTPGWVLGDGWSPTKPKLPEIPQAMFDVTTFGATADATSDNASSIQKTIDAALAAGGGTVRVPAADKPYITGPFHLGSKIDFHLDRGATLQLLPFKATGSTPAYPLAGNAHTHLITARDAHDIRLSGEGLIDGQGAAWWSEYLADRTKALPRRPDIVRFTNCETVAVTGLTFLNSPDFHVAMTNCNNLTISGITIKAPANGPNTDGIDPSGRHILIEHCNVSVGDDNVAVKAGSAFCSDVTIADCTFGTGHGVSIGGQSNRGLDGMTVRNCTFNGTTSGLRMKADPTQGGIVQNVSFSNLTMTNVQYPIVFYDYYNKVGNPGAKSGANEATPAKVNAWNAQPPNSLSTRTMPVWKNITISDITATGSTGHSIIWGLPLPGYFIANVTLNNVHISGGPAFEIYNAENVQLTGDTDIKIDQPIIANAIVLTAPQDQTAAVGSSASFTVSTAGGSGVKPVAPTYQWTSNGTPLHDEIRADGCVISGSTTPTLTLTKIQSAEAGDYAAIVSNSLDAYDVVANKLSPNSAPVSAASQWGRLTVTVPPRPIAR